MGRPLNVYRLDYSPFRSYPQFIWKSATTARPGAKAGVDLLPLHLRRVRNWPGGASLPAWFPGASAAVCLLSIAFGAAGLRNAWGRQAEPSHPEGPAAHP